MPFFGKRNPLAQRQCGFCGKFFQVRSSWPSQRFCSNACYAESIRRIHVTKEELEHWYYELGMTSLEIAERLGCNDRHLREIMEKFGLIRRNKAEAAIEYACRPFSGDRVEKAYLIGFRLGDLNVRKDLETSQRISVRSSTTRPEQVDLIRSLFEPYGHVHTRQGALGETQIECRLDDSFTFLLEKKDRIPVWIRNDDSCFWAFTAGYTDAEGYIGIRSNGNHEQAVVEIASCDGGILQGLAAGMERRSVTCSLHLKGKTSASRNFYCLAIVKKASVDAFFNGVAPYLRHANRRARMERAWTVARA